MRLKNKLLSITLPIILWGLSVNIFGQTQSVTLDQAIEIALQNNREVKIAKMDVEKSLARVSEAFGYALPSVDISAGYTRYIEKPRFPFPDFGSLLNNSVYSILFNEGVLPRDNSKFLPVETTLQAFALTNNYQATVQVTQILFNSAVFRGIGASEIYLNLSKENLKRTVSKTVVTVKKAFYGVLLAKDLLKIAESRLENAEAHLQNTQAMYEEGMVPEFAVMQAKVQVENIRPVILRLKNAFENAKNQLKVLLMMNQSTDLEIIGSMEYTEDEIPSDEDLIDEALASNLDLSTLKIKKQLDEEFVAISSSDYWPTVTAFGNYTYAGSSDDWNFQNYRSSIVGVNFSINLFQGGRTSNKVQQDEIVAMQTGEQISTLRDMIITQVKAKLNDLRRVKQQIETMKKNVELAQRAYEIADSRYKEGEGSQLELKDADIQLSQAKVNYTNAVHDYIIAKAELYDLVGRFDPKYYDYINNYLNK